MFYTTHQLQVFCQDLPKAFLDLGFEVVEDPHVDYALCGFRATYIRRYVLENSTNLFDSSLTTLVHVVGLPFGHQGQKMIIISTPKSVQDETAATAAKIRLQFDTSDQCHVVGSEHINQDNEKTDGNDMKLLFVNPLKTALSRGQPSQEQDIGKRRLAADLSGYVKHIIQLISPGLIMLPTEIKLEILKKMSIQSIIKMSQVNNEFRSLIFQHGETLWRHLCRRDFNIGSINRQMYKSWMELYRDSYIMNEIEKCRKERALPGLPERPALPPAPNLLQIEWFPEVQEAPLYQIENVAPAHDDDQLILAIDMMPFRRANSVDGIV